MILATCGSAAGPAFFEPQPRRIVERLSASVSCGAFGFLAHTAIFCCGGMGLER